MYYENFPPLLEKIKKVATAWHNRSMSVLGKITVINALLASQITYKLMALPTPKEEFFKEYKQIIMKFLWGDKVKKIRYRKLIQKYDQSGLQLVDISAKNHALKASWLAKWTKNKTLENKRWLYINLPVKDSRIWDIDLEPKDFEKLFKSEMDMGAQILKSLLIIISKRI